MMKNLKLRSRLLPSFITITMVKASDVESRTYCLSPKGLDYRSFGLTLVTSMPATITTAVKQPLMAALISTRAARCFRDEDLRGPRRITIDTEMSFATPEDIKPETEA